MPKKFSFKGKTIEELKKLELKEFISLVPARQKRSLSRGFTDQQQILLDKLKKSDGSKPIKTHVRDQIVIPEMVGATLLIHTGKTWTPVKVMEEMLGHYLGEFTQTRKRVAHSTPGIGATRSSAGASQAKT